jgi:protein-disulfide isomerase
MFNKKCLIYTVLVVLFTSGCTVDKKIWEAIARIEKRLDAIEKIVLPPQEEVQQSAYMVPVGKSPVLGKADAKTNIIVFSNFQCPFCAHADKALREAIEDEELKGRVNLVFKHFPFDRHPLARQASKATLAAQEQGKFWDMSEIIFTNQNELGPENIQKWAQKIGLDMNKFNSDLKNNEARYEEQINEEILLGKDVAKLKGTPWILIDGWLFEADAINAATVKEFIKAKNL